jgi:glycosyltransferase involved in cell wall biosynthesis
VEDRLVKRLHDEHPAGAASHVAKPDSYWTSWREETQLADMIVVNSEWSRGALVQEGVAADKMKVVPLAYEPPADALAHEIHAPERFTEARPMRALFLGQVILRKGVYPLLEAIRGLRDEPIEFHFVGPRTIPVDDDVRHSRKVIWHGPIPRDEIGRFYEQADVFLFPTLSDGFGLTQLEALAWGVPVLASKHCGAAVVDGVNGVVLPEVTPGHIEAALRRLLADPSLVRDLGAGARRTRVPGLDDLFFKIAGSSTP